jgi:flap endonuclease-1
LKVLGLKIKDIVIDEQINLIDLENTTMVIDGCNLLFKYLTKIRRNGQVLFDYHGNPVSHILGFFYFTINLLEHKIKPIFIFDGIPPRQKHKEDPVKIRRLVKAWNRYKNLSDKKNKIKHFKDSYFLYKYIIEDLMKFIKKLGLPAIRAPSEGEAQAVRLVKEGKAYGVISRDYDCLAFGCPRLFKNFNFKNHLVHYISLKNILMKNNISYDQLLDLILLLGSDYHPGFKGFGIKTSLKNIKKYGSLDKMKEIYDFNGTDFTSIKEMFKNPVTSSFNIHFQFPNQPVLLDYLLEKNFSIKRINRGISRLITAFKNIKIKQKKLDSFFNNSN